MKVNLSYIIIAVLLATIGWFGYRNTKLNEKCDRIEQNYIAASDSMKILNLENNNLLYEKNAYILKEKELSELLNISQEEIKDIKSKLNSHIGYIANLQGQMKVDTIFMTDTLYYDNDSIPFIKFSYSDDWLSLDGITNIYPPKTTINNIQIPLNIQTGLTTDYNIFVKTDNPYVNINNIDGAVITDKKPKIGMHHEFQVGIGFQYGLFNGQIDFGPQIGYGFIIEF